MTQPITQPEPLFRRLPLTVVAPGIVGLVGILLYIGLSPARVPGELRSPFIILLVAGLVGGVVGRGLPGYLATLACGLVGYLAGTVITLPELGWDLRDFVLGTFFFVITLLLFYSPGWVLAATFRQAVRTTRGTSQPRFLPSATIRRHERDDKGVRRD
jgi:hypothetical protein